MKRSTDKSPAPAQTAARSRPRPDTQVPAAPRALAPGSAPLRSGAPRSGVGPRPGIRSGFRSSAGFRPKPWGEPGVGSRPGSGAPQHGLTLIELLVALSIATLVLTLGVTGMTQMVAQNRRVAEVNTLMGNLNFARAEAVFRMTNVTVCPIDPAESATACAQVKASDNDIQWQQGYIVFVGTVDAPGEVLRVQDRTGSVRIETSPGRPHVTFAPDGSVAGNNLTFRICDVRDQSATDGERVNVVAPRTVAVSPVGRVRVSDQHGTHNIDCSTGSAADDEDTDD